MLAVGPMAQSPAIQSLRKVQALERYAERLADQNVGGVLGDALEAIAQNVMVVAAAAFADDTLERVAFVSNTREAVSADRVQLALRSLSSDAVAKRRTLIATVNDASDPIARELAALGARAALAVPVLHRRTALGAFALMTGTTEALDETVVSFVNAFAYMAAAALARDEVHDEARARRAELEETHRMASLGLLTASVAHELRGPLAALMLQLEEQRRLVREIRDLSGTVDTPAGAAASELGELANEMEAAAVQLRETTEQLSLLSRKDTTPEELDLGTTVDSALALVRPIVRKRGVELSEHFQQSCVIMGRRDNLAQVVLNLVFNAADACALTPHRAPHIGIRVDRENNHIVLSVDDTGPGVPEDSLRLIFRPFYTTKKRGQGTGLGLKVCSDVVSAHGGHIEVLNKPGGGALFRVVLPAREGPTATPVTEHVRAQPGPAASSRPVQILIVDDDPVFARSLRRALRPHDVRTAQTASEAEIALLDPACCPDLVLCDVFLPGNNGDELHRRIHAKRPDVARRFVFVTGGALGKAEADYVRASACDTLFKPIDPHTVLELLDLAEPDSLAPHSVKTLSGAPSRPPDEITTAPPRR